MTPQDKKYFAFISYQRRDEKWADWLRKKLEHYRLPSSLRKRDGSLPREIRPVFRDVLELSGGLLAEEIYQALIQSRFLIVICSPNAAQSPWVNKEIETFVQLGRARDIIPFIIDGTPSSGDPATECFTPALRSLKGDSELLGININEIGRDAAAVKVVARMFGLSFDSLWQRHEREKRRRRMTVIGGTLLLALASLAVGAYIARQNKELDAVNKAVVAERDRANSERDRANAERDRAESANLSLRIANDSILYQQSIIQKANSDLRSSNWSLLESQSRAAAAKALQLLEEGDTFSARRLALSILPKDISNPDRPYVPEAEAALRKSLQVDSSVFRSNRDNDILSFPLFSPDGSLLAAISDNHSILIWDTCTGHLLHTLYGDHEEQFEMMSFENQGKHLQAVTSYGQTFKWDVSSEKLLDRRDGQRPKVALHPSSTVSPDGLYSAQAHHYWKNKYPNIIVVKELCGAPTPLHPITINHASRALPGLFSPDSRSILITQEAEDMHILWGGDVTFSLFNTADGRQLRTINTIKDGMIDAISFNPKGDRILISTVGDRIEVWDASLKKQLWEEREVNRNISSTVSFSPDGNYVLSYGDSLFLRNAQTGLRICALSMKSFCITAAVSPDGRRVAFSEGDQELIVWDIKRNCLDKIIPSPQGRIQSVIFSRDGKELIAGSNQGILFMWNARSGMLTRQITTHYTPKVLSFDRQGAYLVASTTVGPVQIWSYPSGALISSFETGFASTDTAVISPDGRTILTTDELNDVHLWSFPSLQELIDLTHDKYKASPLTADERRMYFLD